jgi:tetratricopeptide (TPR) repeat protein
LLGPACCADAAGLATRAIVLAHLGRHDAADRAFADALAALDTTSPFPAAWLHFARGVMWAEHAGDAARGERHYRLAVAVLPQFFLAQVHLAEIEVARGEVAAALGRLSMLAPSPANPEIDLLRGAILRRCGDEMDARSRFDAARRGYARLADELPDAFAHHREAVERAARTPAPRGGSRRPAGCTRLDRGGT